MDLPPWVADNGDGTYRNPVLHADWSDPDVIRVGDDFYLVASSFHRAPGLPVLHSRDLVNWSIIGHALPRLEPEADFRTPQHGCGVWAPAIRHHAGRFWIFYPDPDRGIFVVTAEDPAGPWTPPHLLKGGHGLIDPCPLWDEDGSAYLVHAWAKSRAGFNNTLTVHSMSPDGTALLDEGRFVIDGDALPAYRTLEGPKFYKRDGWYWIFAPAGGVAQGWQSAFRSRDVFGPYEERIVLEQGDTEINGPHQGAWVTTPGGEHWFLHFQDKGPFGRVVHLQPMRWREDGWPEIGKEGRPVSTNVKPDTGAGIPLTAPAAGDDFDSGHFGPQWAWASNPDPNWHEARPGRLRLACVPTDAAGDLRKLPNLLGQRLPSDRFRATTSVRLDGTKPGARAGLTVLGDTYAWIGLAHTENGPALVSGSATGDDEHESMPTAEVAVGVEVYPSGQCQFLTGPSTEDLRPVGKPFEATAGRWVGATLGLFATTSRRRGRGAAEFDAVRITGTSELTVHDRVPPSDTLELRLGGRPVAEYVWRPQLPTALSPRPFLHPVRTLAGTEVTELMPEDHRHHLGVSVAVPDVGGANFWGGRTFVPVRGSVYLPNHGTQRHHRWESRTDAALVHELLWTGPDGVDLLRESRRITALPIDDRAWAMDFSFELTNVTTTPLGFASPALNGRPDAGYGGFFWRAPRGEGVRVLGPDHTGAEWLHGRRTSWLALNGSGAAPWTLIFVSGESNGDPWFVRNGDYVGVGSSLAWEERLVASPGAGPRRRIITVVADGRLGHREISTIVEAVVEGPSLRED